MEKYLSSYYDQTERIEDEINRSKGGNLVFCFRNKLIDIGYQLIDSLN